MRKLLIGLMLVSSYCYADGVKALDTFLQNKNSTISANFTQTVVGVKKNKVSVGTMEISRPNKFRWEYVDDGQLIISDSKTISIYDKPLQQVTQRKLGTSLGKSPASLLAGGSDIKKMYNIQNLPESAGVEWVNLTPKKAEDNNGFKSVQMGFNIKDSTLAQMKFIDSFNNKTIIAFTNVKTGVAIPERDFKFTPGPGVDVIKSDN